VRCQFFTLHLTVSLTVLVYTADRESQKMRHIMNVPNKLLYTAEATVIGGRDGHACSSDGHLDVPQEMGGAGGFAACFESALMGAARRQKKDIGQVVITNRVGIGPIGGGRMGLAVEMHIQIPGVERAEADPGTGVSLSTGPRANHPASHPFHGGTPLASPV
jgi:lipoyl-dependent peroxiredoxin